MAVPRTVLKMKINGIEKDVINSINRAHVNVKYFPNIRLHPALSATSDKSVLSQADIIFLGIPSHSSTIL